MQIPVTPSTYLSTHVTPWFELRLLPHDPSKAPRPAVPRPRLDDILDRFGMHELGVGARIVEQSSKVDHSRQSSNVAGVPDILVPDDGLTHRLGGRLGRPVLRQQVQCLDRALELEAEVGVLHVLARGADVVEQAR